MIYYPMTPLLLYMMSSVFENLFLGVIWVLVGMTVSDSFSVQITVRDNIQYNWKTIR